MTDLDELIAEAREQAAYLKNASSDGSMPYSGELLVQMADALVSVRAERDADLARIAEAAKLHRKYTYYEHEDSCPDTTEEHREDHHHEASDDIGEFYCDQMPTGDVCCDTCRDVNGDRMDWPCETAKILGIEGGDNPSKTA